jgi:hypothetical protein
MFCTFKAEREKITRVKQHFGIVPDCIFVTLIVWGKLQKATLLVRV